MKYTIASNHPPTDAINDIAMRALAGEEFTVEIKTVKQRTLTQNAALHKYCELLSIALNDAGYDMKRTLKPEAEIPWTMESVKEHLWKPIQKVVIDKDSTTEADTSQYSEVYNVLSRHLSQKLGINCEWPSKR